MSIGIINSGKSIKTETLIIAAMEGAAPQGLNQDVDQQLSHLLALGDLKGEKEEVIVVYPQGQNVKRVVVVGLGKEQEVTLELIRQAVARGIKKVQALKSVQATVDLETFLVNQLDIQAVAEAAALSAVLNQYRFDTYKPEKDTPLKVNLAFSKPEAIRKAVQFGQTVAEGANFARSLGDMPPNELYPESLAKAAQAMVRTHPNLAINVMKKAELEKAGFRALLAVGQGSVHPPVFMELTYQGGKAGQKPIVLVGKGITFDSGGISLKPGAQMDEMRFDMCGAAAVLGVLKAAAELKLPLNLIGMISSAENLPSGSAYRPGDIVRSLSGKTIEVLNTDAEGRVVLADALHRATQRRPECIVDFATLTGAVIVALGHVAAGLVTNQDSLGQELLAAGQASGERLWQLPLWDEYRDLIKSDIADVANISKDRSAGTITGGAFLEKFVNNIAWAHLDIAGTAWGQKNALYGKGVTGAGVRVVMDWLRSKIKK